MNSEIAQLKEFTFAAVMLLKPSLRKQAETKINNSDTNGVTTTIIGFPHDPKQFIMIIDKDINKVPGNKNINGETEFVNFAPYNTFINKEVNGKREIRNMLIHKKT